VNHPADRQERLPTEALEALDVATRAIAGVLSVDEVLQVIVDRVRPLVGAQYAALGIAGGSGTIERFLTSGIDEERRRRIGPLPRGYGLLGLIISENRPIRIADIEEDPRRYGFPTQHPEMHSFLGVPVTVKGRSVGNLYLTNKQDAPEFTEGDERLVEMFALHAGIAIENARLHEQVQRLAVVEERERIGKDLHDGIIQSIYGVGLSLEDVPELMESEPREAAARVERAIEALHLAIRDIRDFILGLRPELLEGRGLVGGLVALAEEFRHNTLVEVDITGIDRELPEPDGGTSHDLLAIAREALSNVARHAKASQASIALGTSGDELVLVVADDGIGFAASRRSRRVHQGLRNMAERAERLGGRLDVDSEFGAGTRAIVRVPLGSGRSGSSRDDAGTKRDRQLDDVAVGLGDARPEGHRAE
jgi:signal transduction histidine kinase